MGAPTILCDFWYGRELAAKPDMLADIVAARPLLQRLCRFSPARALVLLWLSRRYDAVIPDWYRYGRLFLVLAALSGRKNVVLLEVIDYGTRSGAVVDFLARHLLGPCWRRSVCCVHVMGGFECTLLGTRYGLPAERLHFIPFPLIWRNHEPPSWRDPAEATVFSAGRGGCDWPTLFAAAASAKWKLVVVGLARDLPLLTKLNAGVGAEIHTDMPRAQYDVLMSRAAVFVACLKEQMKSSGHIRIGHAIEAGVPVVASGIRCLDEYLVDGETGCRVPPAEARALAQRVDWLLSHPEERQRLAGTAFAHFRDYNKEHYLARIDALLAASVPTPTRGEQ